MNIRPIEFKGCCADQDCDRGNDTECRGGIELSIEDTFDDDDSIGDSICLDCALRLAARIKKAVAQAKAKIKKGKIYRHDKWVTAKREPVAVSQ